MFAIDLRTPKILGGLMAVGVVVATLTSGALARMPSDEARWRDLREAYFQGRPIEDGTGLITLEAPQRAQDAALVPVSVASTLPQMPGRHITSISLLVDANPVPLAAVFRFQPDGPTPAISTRIRVNEYTHVRAIAETSEGKLLMVSKFVKASGGCSAPALKDPVQALARLGKMKLNLPEAVALNKPVSAQLLISHPNNTGMQFDQVSRNYIPPHYIRTVKVRFEGKPVLDIETDISLSEDPSFHFSFVPTAPGRLDVEVRDSKDAVYTADWPIQPDPAS